MKIKDKLPKIKEYLRLPHVGMRKFKSVLAILLSFLIWQLIRIFVPSLRLHPLFAYFYAVLEMRDSAELTQINGRLRIKATAIGLLCGLMFIFIYLSIVPYVKNQFWAVVIELLTLLAGALFTLTVAEIAKCKNFCGVACTIFVICIIGYAEENAYYYAITRSAQTVLGVFSAWLFNSYIFPYHGQPKEKKEEPRENTP
ncbi:MAG: hypothetical protein GX303_03440 [Clostridiales bacterium]|nr:hypothetical protein [Clostridiales bacterium]